MKSLSLAVASGLVMALALPQAIPWISLLPIDPAGHLELLAWVALVPALFALDRAVGAKGAFLVGLAAGLAYFYGAIWWVNHAMTSFGGIPFPVALLGLTLLVLYMAVHWAGAFAVSYTIRRRLGWPLWVHFPAVWTGFELLRNYLFTGFPWGDVGYTQARHTTIAQLASLGGVYALAALVVLVNCALHAALRARLERSRVPVRPVALAAAALLATLGYGAVHLRHVRARAAAAPKLAVALVQGNVNQAVKNQGAAYGDDILRRYVPLTVLADRQGADLVAWPEASYPYLVGARLQSFAGVRSGLPVLTRAHLLVGVATIEERREGGRRVAEGSNSVLLLRPDLAITARYAKHHLVPFGEYVPGWLAGVLRSVVPAMTQQHPGSELTVLEFPAPPARTAAAAAASPDLVRLAPMICFDAIFPEVNVAYAALDPEVLVNPTNDAWYGYSSGPHQFLAMVTLRAIEAGKAVVRPAYAGVSAIIEPTGEVRPGALPVGPVDPDLAPDPAEPPRLLVGDVPRLRGRTLYTTVGDLFAVGASAYGAVALALALRAGRLPRRGRETG
jgi:apolipoprotein N-acyltransferase